MVRKGDKEVMDAKVDAYDNLFKICTIESSHQSEKELVSLKINFAELSKDLHGRMEDFKQKMLCLPLTVIILAWADFVRHDKVFGVRHLQMMQDLIHKKLFSSLAPKNSSVLLKDLMIRSCSEIIDGIRSCEEWIISKREEYVLLYRSFSSWLAKETFGLISEAIDTDRNITEKRKISFEIYAEILSHLDLREQILMKIFYLGGRRNLEEVLSITIEDVDFNRNQLKFSEGIISYPQHLLYDIKRYVKDRKKGQIFIGKEGERISHTTPFRALKTVLFELKYNPEWTFKDFSQDI